MKEVRFVAGEKGGVGKSFVTEIMIALNQECIPVDSDTKNPDIAKYHSDSIMYDLTQSQDLFNFLQIVSESEKEKFIVSLPARALESFIENREILGQLKEYDISLNMTFVLNTGDSVALFALARKALESSINFDHVVLNGRFGERREFDKWDSSKCKNGGELKDGYVFSPFTGRETFLKDYSKKPIEKYFIKREPRLSLRELLKEINQEPLINRLCINQFFKEIKETFGA